MATTAIWSVKGWLGKIINYAQNPDKTENSDLNNSNMLCLEPQGLQDVITYAMQDIKVKEENLNEEEEINLKYYVSGINCLPSTARQEMLATKRRFNKDGGTVAFHGYQSFANKEVTPDLAHTIGVRLATEMWGESFQVIVATHLDKKSHIHNHFVINSVSFTNGLRYNDCLGTYAEIRKKSDELCHEYGLSVIDNPQRGKSKNYGEWQAERENHPTWRGLVKADIDRAIQESMTQRQFYEHLEKQGYSIKLGKDISVKPNGKARFVRLQRNFGDEYSYEGITKKLLKNKMPFIPVPERKLVSKKYKFIGKMKNTKKLTGLRALYIHYCYMLGIFPKNKPKTNKRLHFLLREDLRKMDDISNEAKLLCINHIDSAEELFSYKEALGEQIKVLIDERKLLQNKARCKEDSKARLEIRATVSPLSAQIRKLRKEVMLCENIEKRSQIIKEKLSAVQKDEIQTRKEKKENEPFRRRSGTNSQNELGRL